MRETPETRLTPAEKRALLERERRAVPVLLRWAVVRVRTPVET